MSSPWWFDELPEYMTEYDIWEIREFHLDAAAAGYRLHAVHTSVLELEQPMRLTLPISDLVSG